MNQKIWLRERKKLLNQIKGQVELLLGAPSPALSTYLQAYQAEFRRRWKPVKEKEWIHALDESQMVLGGDFHAFAQSQRVHLRILRSLPSRPLVLALECIESRDQKILDQFMAGELEEDQFLKKIKWEKRWSFPWSHYRPLFDWARENSVPVFGLNRHEARRNTQSLNRRDQHAAKTLKALRKKFPEHLIYVIFGDLHLASQHLPQYIAEYLPREPHPLILMQNAEELYFRFAKDKHESPEWLQAGEHRFCHLSSPPWVKWQSYLMFLEQSFDHDFYEEDRAVDMTDQVASLIRFLSRDLKLKVPLNQLAVYTSGQRAFDEFIEANMRGHSQRIAQGLVAQDRSFYLPLWGVMYLSRASINHAATLAGWFIHAHLSTRKSELWEMPEDFLRLIWIEAVGFFFSKLINHKRKSENIRDLRARIVTLSSSDKTRSALQLALDQRMREVSWIHTEKRRGRLRKKYSLAVFLNAARLLGEMLGERIYHSYRTRRLSRQQLVTWLKADVEDVNFDQTYYEIVREVEWSRLPTKKESELSFW